MQLFVDDLTVIDFSYLCTQRGIVGESWIVDVLLDGSLNEMSMVLDFAVVKKQIKAIIDDAVDHKLLLPIQEQAVTLADSPHNDGHQTIDFISDAASYYLQSPACAFASIDCLTITIPAVTKHLTTIILSHLPDNVKGLTLVLRPENIPTDYYHYTHGLKLHDGNCQRIAHGHRSKVVVFENQQESIKWQEYWANRWCDIYIGSTEDIVDASETVFSMPDGDAEQHHVFAYESSQGRFELAIPKAESEMMDTDTTVECLAQYMADEHKRMTADSDFKVLAYEGVGKGAIAFA